MTAVIIPFKRRPFAFSAIERVITRDQVVEEPDGSWWSGPRRPPGPGWEIEKDRERHTVWRRAV